MLSIRRVLAPNPSVYTLEGTNTWIVGSGPTIVIDPGPDLPQHLADVAREAGSVGAVLVTHDHPDHAPGAIPFARLVGAPVFASRLAGAERLSAGQEVRAGDIALTTVQTPGHTSDHVAFFEPASGALFTGDTVLGRGTSFIDPPDGDLVQYLRSLRRLLDLDPRSIYPGHGPTVLRAREKLLEYLAHREEREAQVVAALAEDRARSPRWSRRSTRTTPRRRTRWRLARSWRSCGSSPTKGGPNVPARPTTGRGPPRRRERASDAAAPSGARLGTATHAPLRCCSPKGRSSSAVREDPGRTT